MKNSYKFLCPKCKKYDFQSIRFIGGEFHLQCDTCLTFHIMLENFYENPNQNLAIRQKHKVTMNRYLGSYSQVNDTFYEEDIFLKNHYGVSDAFGLFRDLINAKIGNIDTADYVERIIIDKSERNTIFPIFMCSVVYPHFQDSFRGLYNMRYHIDHFGCGEHSYNILIVCDDAKYDYIYKDIEKVKGINEIWKIKSKSRNFIWYLQNEDYEFEKSAIICHQINKMINDLEGMGTVISKKTFSFPDSKHFVRNILEPNRKIDMLTKMGEKLDSKNVFAILVRKANPKYRLDLDNLDIMRTITRIVKENSDMTPLIVYVDPSEVMDIDFCDSISLFSIDKQVDFYKRYVRGLIGVNSSGCNIPSLFRIPMFVLAKNRFFPDDFYCFGRMISEYKPLNHLYPFCGDLDKSHLVQETQVSDENMEEMVLSDKFKNFVTAVDMINLRNCIATPKSIYFFGGSITYMKQGWREQIELGDIEKINSSIPNSSSIVADLLLEEKCPMGGDVAFVEFVVNDKLEIPKNEKMVRDAIVSIVEKFHKNNVPVCFVYFLQRYADSYDLKTKGKIPSLEIYEEIAKHYDIPSIDTTKFYVRNFDKIDFHLRDSCHHTPEGGKIIAEHIKRCCDLLFSTDTSLEKPKEILRNLNTYNNSKITNLLDNNIVGEKVEEKEYDGKRYHVLNGDSIIEMKLKEKPRIVLLDCLVGPYSGFIKVVCNEESHQINLFDEWCYYERNQYHFILFGLKDAEQYSISISLCQDEFNHLDIIKPDRHAKFKVSPHELKISRIITSNLK